MISAAEAVQRAKRGLLSLWPENGPAAAAGDTGQMDEPLLVARLDAGGHYWLVPWRVEAGITAIVQVDASSGRVTTAGKLANPAPRIVPAATEAIAAVTTATDRTPVNEPRLVWRPCRESATPLRPFYEVATDRGELYVDADGAVHRELTPFGRGG